MGPQPRLIEVRKNVLKQNDLLARSLREQFRAAGVFVVSLVSSPGSGKTAFLGENAYAASAKLSRCALVGDLATENDAMRLARSRRSREANHHGTLAIWMRPWSRTRWKDGTLRSGFSFHRNVGNLVCPSSYDLGENLRLVLISVTEGEDKPLKYPTIFNSADVALVTKMDLAAGGRVRLGAAYGNIQAVRPGMQVLKKLARPETGDGMDVYLKFLTARRDESRAVVAI